MQRKSSRLRFWFAMITLLAVSFSVSFVGDRLKAKATMHRATVRHFEQHTSSRDATEFYEFVEALPSHQALRSSLEDVPAASAELLRAAVLDDEELLSLRTHNYRQSLRRVRDNFEVLAGRIGRDRVCHAFQELTTRMDEQWEFTWQSDEVVLRTTAQEETVP
ncbi:MAG: hypothetical protein CMJ50_05535 [Planctomycetaceae bacterium]|nr:hypothetical protein [Planctomycetaceae bacterium]